MYPWLPPLFPLQGDWQAYENDIYARYCAGFVRTQPTFEGKPVRRKAYPHFNNKCRCFMHLTTTGPDEQNREPDLRRCERIEWPRRIIDLAGARPSPILTWRQARTTSWGPATRVVLALPDFSYLVVLDQRSDYFLLWTTFYVEYESQRRKKRAEFSAATK